MGTATDEMVAMAAAKKERFRNAEVAAEALRRQTDGWPWYWVSYGEKCYAFAVVEAYPADEDAPWPRPGSQLYAHPTDSRMLIGDDDVTMIVEQHIAGIEAQNGAAICRFIAEAHAALFVPDKTFGR